MRTHSQSLSDICFSILPTETSLEMCQETCLMIFKHFSLTWGLSFSSLSGIWRSGRIEGCSSHMVVERGFGNESRTKTLVLLNHLEFLKLFGPNLTFFNLFFGPISLLKWSVKTLSSTNISKCNCSVWMMFLGMVKWSKKNGCNTVSERSLSGNT